jgi:prephenate dehydrogenase
MQYFILPLGYKQQDLVNENYLLGEQSFKVFWAGTGFNRLQRIIKEAPDVLEHIIILDNTGKEYSVEAFLEAIKKLQVREQN